jgi:predicted DCC family thiol-disulfide oxidoreductase YuxK
MKTLTIFYDPTCGLCANFRKWLEARPRHVAIRFLGYNSPAAKQLFPGLDGLAADRDIVVLADDGRWWQGESAWLTCLWTTHEYRPWSFRLAAPIFRPLVRKAVHLLSENRLSLSRLLGMKHDARIATAVGAITETPCVEGTCHFPPPMIQPHLKK